MAQILLRVLLFVVWPVIALVIVGIAAIGVVSLWPATLFSEIRRAPGGGIEVTFK